MDGGILTTNREKKDIKGNAKTVFAGWGQNRSPNTITKNTASAFPKAGSIFCILVKRKYLSSFILYKISGSLATGLE